MFYSNLLGQRAMMVYWTRLRSERQGRVRDRHAAARRPALRRWPNAGRREAFVPVAPLKPGEDRDLGTITLKERQAMSGRRTEQDALRRSPGRAGSPTGPVPDAPWDAARVAHLHRRAGLGATWGQLQRDLREGFEPSIRRILDGEARGPGRPAGRGVRRDRRRHGGIGPAPAFAWNASRCSGSTG